MESAAITNTRQRPLAEILDEHSITQAAISRRTGLGTTTIHNATKLSGHPLHVETATLIANALGLKVEDIRWPGLVYDQHVPLRQNTKHGDDEPRTGGLCLGCFTIKSCSNTCECSD